MRKPKNVTVSELREIIRAALVACEWGQGEIEGYIRAHEFAGWLRPKCPQWMRDSGAVIYQVPPLGSFAESPPSANSMPAENAGSKNAARTPLGG